MWTLSTEKRFFHRAIVLKEEREGERDGDRESKKERESETERERKREISRVRASCFLIQICCSSLAHSHKNILPRIHTYIHTYMHESTVSRMGYLNTGIDAKYQR